MLRPEYESVKARSFSNLFPQSATCNHLSSWRVHMNNVHTKRNLIVWLIGDCNTTE